MKNIINKRKNANGDIEPLAANTNRTINNIQPKLLRLSFIVKNIIYLL